MSDVSRATGTWLASDGKLFPQHLRQSYRQSPHASRATVLPPTSWNAPPPKVQVDEPLRSGHLEVPKALTRGGIRSSVRPSSSMSRSSLGASSSARVTDLVDRGTDVAGFLAFAYSTLASTSRPERIRR